MATIHRDITVATSPERLWSAVQDVGAPHERLAPGVVVDGRREGEHRVVTFAGGAVVRERILDVDHDARRVAYAVVESQLGFTYHHAEMRVVAVGEGARSRLLWTTDLVPDDLASAVADLMDQCGAAMQHTLAAEPAPATGA